MYKVAKGAGAKNTITITNEETNSSINIGVLNTKIIDILRECDDIPFTLNATEEWNYTVNKETGNKLAMTAFRAHKPMRKVKEKTEQSEPAAKKSNSQAAYDFLFGYSDEL